MAKNDTPNDTPIERDDAEPAAGQADATEVLPTQVEPAAQPAASAAAPTESRSGVRGLAQKPWAIVGIAAAGVLVLGLTFAGGFAANALVDHRGGPGHSAEERGGQPGGRGDHGPRGERGERGPGGHGPRDGKAPRDGESVPTPESSTGATSVPTPTP